MKNIEERRRFIRLEVPLALKYIVESGTDARRIEVMTKDISCDGLRFTTDCPIKESDILEINLTIPKANNPVHLEGKAVWVKKAPSEKSPLFEVGIEFTRIEEDNKNTFLKYICDLLYGQTKIMGYEKTKRGVQ